MPHECATCGHTFPDGSKEMLSGCPECGGNKFQYLPSGAVGTAEAAEADESPAAASADDPSAIDPSSPAGDDTPSSNPPSDTSDPFDYGSDETTTDDSEVDTVTATDSTSPTPKEDRAQASARSAVVSEDELPTTEELTPEGAGENPNAIDEEDRPDLDELREELNDQFESIKILQPGEYELNLMELYDREERIVALEEDGRYVIDVPSSWREEE